MKISEQEVKYLLKNQKEIEKHNKERILALYKEMENQDSMERYFSMKTNRFGEVLGGTTVGGVQDLGDVLEKVQTMQRTKVLDIRTELHDRVLEDEKISRLMVCYECLGKINIRWHKIIRRLYVEGETYLAVNMEMGISHKTFENARKKAVEMMRTLYESEDSNSQIIMKAGSGGRQSTPTNPAYCQLSLDIPAAARGGGENCKKK